MVLSEHHLLASCPRRSPVRSRPVRLAERQLGGRGAAGERPGLQPLAHVAGQLPASVLDLAQPKWKGKVAIAPTDSDFVPLVGAVIAVYGTRGARAWLAGLKAKRRSTRTTSRWSPRSTAGRRRSASSTSTTGTGSGWRSAPGTPQQAVLLPESRRRGHREHLRCGRARLLAAQDRRGEVRLVPRLRAGPEDPRRRRQLRVPGTARDRANPALPPLSQVDPAVLSVVRLGNDQRAALLVQQSGLT